MTRLLLQVAGWAALLILAAFIVAWLANAIVQAVPGW